MIPHKSNDRSVSHRMSRRTFTSSYNTYRSTQPSADSQPPAVEKVARKSAFRLPLRFRLVLVALVLMFVGGHVVWSQHVSAEAAASRRAQQQSAALAAHKTAIFAAQVQAIVAAHPELSMSVVVASGSRPLQQYGSTTSFDAASTAKLVTAADFLRHVERGQATLMTQIDGQTAQYWLKIMIINSDDTAWAELNNYLGNNDLQSYAQSIGFTDYDAATNTVTASDITDLLQKLYNRQLLNSSSRSLLLSYMSQANYRGFIVAAVPPGDTVYHKIGIYNDSVHDAAIITNGSQSFVLTIFTDGNGTYNWDARATIMQSIAKDAMAAYL